MSSSSTIHLLKQYWKSDIISGFMVFLLALPLCLGIAKASGFPAAMGVVSAICGGLLSVFFRASEPAVKGPAAGLITICAASVADLGGGDTGWTITCAAIVIMAVFQVLLGVFRLGDYGDFFPRPVVYGLLAAIGLIIIAKQMPVMLGLSRFTQGMSPLRIFVSIWKFIPKLNWPSLIISLIALAILFGVQLSPWTIVKKLPAPLMVLVVTMPIAPMFNWTEAVNQDIQPFVVIGDFWGSTGLHADFSAIGNWLFWKSVFMILFVSSLESVLTVKAVDQIDPLRRTGNINGDLIAQGTSNFFSGLLGGLPSISEVLRSSANINFGGRTRWANFFHALFLLLAMAFTIPLIEKIPNTALAAMLFFAGYNLCAPKHFREIFRIGQTPFAIFLTTILVTLAEDLLLGVLAGIILNIIMHCVKGAKLRDLFRSAVHLETHAEEVNIRISGAAAFTNTTGIRKKIKIPAGTKRIYISTRSVYFMDFSFLSFLRTTTRNWENAGIEVVAGGFKKDDPSMAQSNH